MAYAADGAAALRALLAGRNDVAEKPMFGGLTFMVAGHMCCGVTAREFVFRVGPHHYERALAVPAVTVCDFTGRTMKGMVMTPVGGAADTTLATLADWALDFVLSLPEKP